MKRLSILPAALAPLALLAACATQPAGPRPMPLALDEAPFVALSPAAREELTLRPDRSYVLRRIPANQKPAVKTGYYEVVNLPGQAVLLDNQEVVRIAFVPDAPIPLTFTRLPLTAMSNIPLGQSSNYTHLMNQYHVPSALLAPAPGEHLLSPLLQPRP